MENFSEGIQEKQSKPAKRWVLVVDDEPGFRNLLQWVLSERGLNVQVARDGAEAVKLAKEGNFSLVVTDVTMPRLDGLKLLEQLKKEMPGTAVIVVTGFGTVETAVYAMKKGASDFILKPFDMGMFAKAVEEALPAGG